MLLSRPWQCTAGAAPKKNGDEARMGKLRCVCIRPWWHGCVRCLCGKEGILRRLVWAMYYWRSDARGARFWQRWRQLGGRGHALGRRGQEADPWHEPCGGGPAHVEARSAGIGALPTQARPCAVPLGMRVADVGGNGGCGYRVLALATALRAGDAEAEAVANADGRGHTMRVHMLTQMKHK